MKLTKNITLALAVLTTTAGFAQTTPAATPATGNLGQRYVQIDASLFDQHNTSDNAYGAGAGVNLPVHSNVDLGFNYDYSWLKTGGAKIDAHVVNALATAYTSYSGVKPFASVGLGYQWAKATNFGFSAQNDAGIWGVAVGAEIPISEVTFTPSISYVDGLNNKIPGTYNYGVEVSTWVTKTVGLFADVSFEDVVGASGAQGWTYSAGLRLKF